MNPMLESFISESRDNLEEASQCFLSLEQSPNDPTVMQNLFRAMHTIKGSSGLFELGAFTHLMHVAEDVLDLARAGKIQLNSDHIDVLLSAMDQITDWIDELEATGELNADADNKAQPHILALSEMIPVEHKEECDELSLATKSHQTTHRLGYSEIESSLGCLSDQQRFDIFQNADQLTFLRYTPQESCFFTGDDPLHTARLTPSCQHLRIVPVAKWPTIDSLDPYQCQLSFDVISSADEETLIDHYRYVEDDIKLCPLDMCWLAFPQGQWSDDQSLFSDVLPELKTLIDKESWHNIPNLIAPILELANPSVYQISCMRWIKAIAEKEALEKPLIEALFTAIETGEFDYSLKSEVDSDSTESHQTDADTITTDTGPQTEYLSNDVKTLLATQARMLEFSNSDDLEGRVDSVERIFNHALPEEFIPNDLLDVCQQAKQEQSANPLIILIRSLLDSTPPLEANSLESTENDVEETLDIATLVRQEQALRAHESEAAADESALDQASLISPAPSPIDLQQPISDSMSELARTDLSSTQSVAKEPVHNQKPKVLKVDQHRIDMLMDLVGELVVAKNSLPYLAKKAEDEFNVRALAKEIKSQYAIINRLAESMQSTMMQIRMVPVSTIFQRFPRLVRDLSRKLSKDVRLVLEGEESEADKNVVENLADPLIHLVRNSLDHGFETEEERVGLGKPAQGSLYLRAIPKDDQVIIEVDDDGRGMDPAKLKQSAYRKGIISEQKLETITDQEALYLIFAPGFSTAEQVSDLSGRGVGMDVVNGLVQQAGGRVTIDSELGKGTTIRLYLPLTMAVSRVMMVEVQQQCFGISMENIVETVKVPHDRLLRIKQGEAIVLRDKVIPVLSLHSLLALPETQFEEEVPLLIMNLNGEDIALKIDLFHEGIDIVQKPLAGLMSQYNYYSGSALLGDGRVLLILNIKELLSCQ